MPTEPTAAAPRFGVQVAERIRAFQDLGIELFMLQFQPFEVEMRRFAEHVIPRVRAAAVPA